MAKIGIRAALSSDSRDTVRAAIEAATQAAPDLEARAKALEAESLNPALSDAQAAKARADHDAARFQAERMAAALTALQERDAALAAAESEAARQARYSAAQATLQAALARHAAEWDAHAMALAGLVLEIERAKAAADAANADLPADALRLTLPAALVEIRTQARRLRTADGARVLADWPQHDGGAGCVPLTAINGGKAA
ncbi:MAG: hypothetical protein JJT99_08710 [Rhodobacteraceae bacterium]|nr:hypothetical protein [Paracoccaceae bacterium]